MLGLDMSTDANVIIVGLFTCLAIALIAGGVIDEIKYNRFCSRLYVGCKICNVVKSICNEFDEGDLFIATVIKLGDTQVMLRFEDGSETLMSKKQLFDENWKFIDEL